MGAFTALCCLVRLIHGQEVDYSGEAIHAPAYSQSLAKILLAFSPASVPPSSIGELRPLAFVRRSAATQDRAMSATGGRYKAKSLESPEPGRPGYKRARVKRFVKRWNVLSAEDAALATEKAEADAVARAKKAKAKEEHEKIAAEIAKLEAQAKAGEQTPQVSREQASPSRGLGQIKKAKNMLLNAFHQKKQADDQLADQSKQADDPPADQSKHADEKSGSASSDAAVAAAALSAMTVLGIDVASLGIAENAELAIATGAVVLAAMDDEGPVGETLRTVGGVSSAVVKEGISAAAAIGDFAEEHELGLKARAIAELAIQKAIYEIDPKRRERDEAEAAAKKAAEEKAARKAYKESLPWYNVEKWKKN